LRPIDEIGSGWEKLAAEKIGHTPANLTVGET